MVKNALDFALNAMGADTLSETPLFTGDEIGLSRQVTVGLLMGILEADADAGPDTQVGRKIGAALGFDKEKLERPAPSKSPNKS